MVVPFKLKQNAEHLEAQRLGLKGWYSEFKVRVAKVEREYGESRL